MLHSHMKIYFSSGFIPEAFFLLVSMVKKRDKFPTLFLSDAHWIEWNSNGEKELDVTTAIHNYISPTVQARWKLSGIESIYTTFFFA